MGALVVVSVAVVAAALSLLRWALFLLGLSSQSWMLLMLLLLLSVLLLLVVVVKCVDALVLAAAVAVGVID